MVATPTELPIDQTAVRYASCHAAFSGRELVLRNAHVERRWRVEDGMLYPTSFRDLATGREWLARAARTPSPTPPFTLPDEVRTLSCRAWGGAQGPTEELSLVVELESRGGGVTLLYRFQVFPGARGVTVQLITEGAVELTDDTASGATAATGIERPETGGLPPADMLEFLDLNCAHLRLTQVELCAQTDIHNTLTQERTWLLHPNDGTLALAGNLFALEDPLTGEGMALLKHAPLPGERPCPTEADLRVHASGGALYVPRPEQEAFGPEHPRHPLTYPAALYGHGTGQLAGTGYPYTVLCYTGGATGRTRALHELQRQFRIVDTSRDVQFLSNTWGDRAQDSRVCDAFLRAEIAAAARLGVDVVQIDDGWQQGRTANSVQRGGVWQGYWASDAAFWTVHPERFPDGLAPLVALARAQSMRLGLWFAPDSADDFAQWERDADAIIGLHDHEDINYVKLDSVNITSRLGEARFAAFIDRVLRGTRGQVSFDLDITAQRRPGYFGAMTAGPLFLENRYSDFRRYWPHQTLRNLWALAHYVDPARLRMELLNPARNTNIYIDDPLAPACYPPAYLFATTMMANPLGWFEVSNLPEDVIAGIAPLAQIWKAHRARLFAGHILPIGAEPDGTAWTGFVSEAPGGGGYLLVFRELNTRAAWTTDLDSFAGSCSVNVLAGDGEATVADGQLRVTIPEAQRFLFAEVRPA
jgi:alpha-galactosidase